MAVAIEDVELILTLLLDSMEEEEAQAALDRLVVMRSPGGFPADDLVEGTLEEAVKAMRQKDLDALVVRLLEERTWHRPLPLLGLEMAVREHLFRQGFAYQVEKAAGGPLFRVRLSRTKPRPWMEERVTQAPWAGMLALARRWR